MINMERRNRGATDNLSAVLVQLLVDLLCSRVLTSAHFKAALGPVVVLLEVGTSSTTALGLAVTGTVLKAAGEPRILTIGSEDIGRGVADA
jgi:hypothetical protein